MKRATSKDVAKLAGVSQTTVSFVMNNTPNVSLSEETRKKVLDAANQLQYIPNSFARGLKTSQSKLLGVFLPTMDNPYYPMLMQYIEKYTARLGYSVILCCTYRNPEREKAYLDLCEEKHMDGVIYLFTPNWMKRVVQLSHTIPVVLLSEKSDDIPLNTISLMGFDVGIWWQSIFGSGTQEYRFPDELCFFGLPDPYKTSGGYQKCHSRCGSAAGNASGFYCSVGRFRAVRSGSRIFHNGAAAET